jgi:hypothetical protein
MTKEQVSSRFAYASLACSLSVWIVFALNSLFSWLRLSPPGWKWVASLVGWQWTFVEAFGLLLAIIATVLGLHGAKLWRLALPVSLLMFLLTFYAMVS